MKKRRIESFWTSIGTNNKPLRFRSSLSAEFVTIAESCHDRNIPYILLSTFFAPVEPATLYRPPPNTFSHERHPEKFYD